MKTIEFSAQFEYFVSLQGAQKVREHKVSSKLPEPNELEAQFF